MATVSFSALKKAIFFSEQDPTTAAKLITTLIKEGGEFAAEPAQFPAGTLAVEPEPPTEP